MGKDVAEIRTEFHARLGQVARELAKELYPGGLPRGTKFSELEAVAGALGDEMARLRRSCYRLYWLDPLASQPGFTPAVAGLKAALPHVDGLLPCATVASLEDLANRLIEMTTRSAAVVGIFAGAPDA